MNSIAAEVNTVASQDLLPRVPVPSDIEGVVESVFDNKGVTIDRYSVVVVSPQGEVFTVRATPFQERSRGVLEVEKGKSLTDDDRIEWWDLPEEVQIAVWSAICEIK